MGKVLIAYFSWNNTSNMIAKVLYEKIESDIIHIESVKNYSTTVIGAEVEKSCPNLLNKIDKIDKYEIIILVYPNWRGTIPIPVYAFLEQFNLEGKIIIPICMNEGSGLGKSVQDIKTICSKSIVFEGISILKSQIDSIKTKNEIVELLISV